MLPYLEPPILRIGGGLELNAFGILAATGVGVGAAIARRAARDYWPGNSWPLVGVLAKAAGLGLLGAHAMHVLLYHPEVLHREGVSALLHIWDGLSSMGGVLGAMAGIVWHLRSQNVRVMPYLDAIALGGAPAWALGRVGCALVHDHIGRPSHFLLAVNFPSSLGGPRHDLGIYEALVLFGITAILFLAARRRPPEGRLMGLLIVLYTPSRFALDFLRADDLPFVDARYFGLTPAQYVALVLIPVGLWLLLRSAPSVRLLAEAPTGDG